jgi:cytochrome c-type biogenesis protein CcmF
MTLGVGILVGAVWAYEELGWGGYWGWDPVENGSLIPWLTGTALIHAMLVWQYRGGLKKTALGLCVATFGLCNFATFLTRSGIFGGLHEFSRSPIGWMFLAGMSAMSVAGVCLVILRRRELAGDRPIASLWSREAFVLVSAIALVLLAVITFAGTTLVPVSNGLFGRKVTVGASFYNGALVPIGLLLLATTASAPLLRWSAAPSPTQRRTLMLGVALGAMVAAYAGWLGVRHPIAIGVTWLTVTAVAAFVGALLLDLRQQRSASVPIGWLKTLASHRRRYAGSVAHLGFVCLAVGVTGSSLGTRRCEVAMKPGETVTWAGRSIRFAGLAQQRFADKLVVEGRLEIARDGRSPVVLHPAQHWHMLTNQWTAEVAIDSTWTGDFYTILHSGRGEDQASLSFVENPLMRWLWLSGVLAGIGVLIGLWPARRRAALAANADAGAEAGSIGKPKSTGRPEKLSAAA